MDYSQTHGRDQRLLAAQIDGFHLQTPVAASKAAFLPPPPPPPPGFYYDAGAARAAGANAGASAAAAAEAAPYGTAEAAPYGTVTPRAAAVRYDRAPPQTAFSPVPPPQAQAFSPPPPPALYAAAPQADFFPTTPPYFHFATSATATPATSATSAASAPPAAPVTPGAATHVAAFSPEFLGYTLHMQAAPLHAAPAVPAAPAAHAAAPPEAELTIDDILNHDPFSSLDSSHNYTHNDDDDLLAELVDFSGPLAAPLLPVGLGLGMESYDDAGRGVGASESSSPVYPPAVRLPKRITTSPSRALHPLGVKKLLRKSSSFTNGQRSPSAAAPGAAAPAGFQVQLSNSGSVRQQPRFSLSDCSNSFLVNTAESFLFVMEMAPQSPLLSKLRRKSLSKLPRLGVDKPPLRSTQLSYFAHEQPQRMLKEMNDGVVVFQLDTRKP
jgi:hypothetical protein